MREMPDVSCGILRLAMKLMSNGLRTEITTITPEHVAARSEFTSNRLHDLSSVVDRLLSGT